MLDRCTLFFQLRRRTPTRAVVPPPSEAISTANGLTRIDLTLDSPEVRLHDYETYLHSNLELYNVKIS